MSIKPLNKSTVKLITSTQIITSVSSVVKELVENSFDAGSKNIEINLSDNGLSAIEIRDDGSGVPVDDVPNMALPHSTSKISEFSDLESLSTYGFRGEALNAICKVAASVTVTTKTSQAETAKIYTLDNNGNILGEELSPRFNGTTVRVNKLFDNIPVRRQMISDRRKSKQDIKYIENVLKSLSICNPTVRMSYRVNSSLVFLKPSCVDVKEALSHFLGSKVIANLEWICYEDFKMKMQLMIPKKESIKESHLVYESNEQFVIMNNRPVKSKEFEKVIGKRINEHFGAGAPLKKRAVYFVSITVPPGEIDVNLEPNKTSVLLKNQDTILQKLDNVLVEFYNLCDENTRPDCSALSTSIDGTPEYHDLSNGIEKSGIEVPACKKIKLNNNKQQRSRDFVVDLNADNCDTKRKSAERKSSGIKSTLVLTPGEKMTRSKPPDVWKDGRNILEEISGDKIDRHFHEDSMDRIMRSFSGPVLSDSDSESNLAKESSKAESKVGHAARPSSSADNNQELESVSETALENTESFALSPDNPSFGRIFDERNASAYPSENYDESLSQLPIVDLGEDFDIETILETPGKSSKAKESTDPSTTSGDNKSSNEAENIEKSKITLELWSRGQVPGLKDPTHVSVLNDSKNRSSSSNEDRRKRGDQSSQTIYHTGFSKFSHEIRSQVMEENPGATLPEIGKIFANRWKELSPEERGYYRDLALEEKRKAEAEKKIIKNNKLSEQEADKNKVRLIQMLETMKKTRTTKKCSIDERTAVPWEITVQDITENFFAKETSDSERIIGRLTDEIWAVKFDEKICVMKSSEVLKEASESIDAEKQQKILTSENSRTILSSYLRDKKINVSLFHPIHSIVSCSSSIIELQQ